ncbi:MAG: hypothetical protein M1816_000946 [Peltula sp. TS41687]|nr:MAG: hypothetical protein M1816_000946 [Peltula sp. TS41687]
MQLNLLAIPLLLASSRKPASDRALNQIVVDDESFQYLTTGIKVKCDQPLSRVDFRAFPRHGTTEVPNSSVYAARTTSANNLYTGRLYFPPNIGETR